MRRLKMTTISLICSQFYYLGRALWRQPICSTCHQLGVVQLGLVHPFPRWIHLSVWQVSAGCQLGAQLRLFSEAWLLIHRVSPC